QQLAGLVCPVRLAVSERQLEDSALQVVDEDFEIVGVDAGALRRRFKEVVRPLDDVLVHWRRRGDEYGYRGRLTPPRATGALPGRGDRAGVAGQHAGVERADIDAQLQRAGRD